MFWQRIVSAIIGIPLLVAAVWYGGIVLITLTAALILLGIWEISRVFSQIDLRVPFALALPGCLTIIITAYRYQEGFTGAAVAFILIINLLAVIFFYPKFSPLDAAVTFFSTIYVGLIVYLFLISTFAEGLNWLILLLVCTWTSDTAAYLVGRKWGRRRIAPILSPGKTIEGAIGGVLGSLTAAVVLPVIYWNIPLLPVAILGLALGIAAQLGDLFESAIKRQAGIKDAGNLIPGHGGILDRFDSMLFTAPLVYYYVGAVIN